MDLLVLKTSEAYNYVKRRYDHTFTNHMASKSIYYASAINVKYVLAEVMNLTQKWHISFERIYL